MKIDERDVLLSKYLESSCGGNFGTIHAAGDITGGANLNTNPFIPVQTTVIEQDYEDDDDQDGIRYYDLVASDTWNTDKQVIVIGEDEARQLLEDGNAGRWPMHVVGSGMYCSIVSSLRWTSESPRYKPSLHIGREAIDVFNGISFANYEYGLVLNTHITLALGNLGVTDHAEAANIHSEFNHRVRKWLASPKRIKQCEHVYVYAHEARSRIGLAMHSHNLTHIPESEQSAFQKKAIKWVSALTGRKATKKDVYVVHGRSARLRDQIWLQWRWYKYICKGIDPKCLTNIKNPATGQYDLVKDVFGLRGWRMGVVECRKRTGMSENIQSTARNEARYGTPADCGDYHDLYTGWEFDAFRQRREQAECERMMNELSVRI